MLKICDDCGGSNSEVGRIYHFHDFSLCKNCRSNALMRSTPPKRINKRKHIFQATWLLIEDMRRIRDYKSRPTEPTWRVVRRILNLLESGRE